MCKFCNNSGDHRYTYSDNGVKYFINLFGNRYLRIGIEDKNGLNFRKYPKIESMKINFCPFCGRDLNSSCNYLDESAKKEGYTSYEEMINDKIKNKNEQ